MLDYLIRFLIALVAIPVIVAAFLAALYIPVWLGFGDMVKLAWGFILLAAVIAIDAGRK
jgi:hypothetical protein